MVAISLATLPYLVPWEIVAIALAIAAAIPAVGTMLAELLRSSELRAWSRKEFNEVISTVLMIAGIIISLVFMDSIIMAVSGQGYFDSAKAYLSRIYYVMYNTGFDFGFEAIFYSILSSLEIDYGFIAGRLIELTTGGIAAPIVEIINNFAGINFSPFAAFGGVTGPLTDAMKFCFNTLFFISAQMALLDFIEKIVLTTIFPLGIVMRAFPLTRKTGSTLIALSAIAYVIFPLSVNLGGIIYGEMESLMPREPNLADILSTGVEGNVTVYPLRPIHTAAEAGTASAKWAVYGTGIYRIWHSVSDECPEGGRIWGCVCAVRKGVPLCDQCEDGSPAYRIWNGGGMPLQQPPLNPANPGSYSTWEVKFFPIGDPVSARIRCFQFVRSGTFDGSVKYISQSFDGFQQNRTHGLMLDIYHKQGNNYIAAGLDDVATYIGDPGAANAWTAPDVRTSKMFETYTELKASNSYTAFFDSILRTLKSLGTDFASHITPLTVPALLALPHVFAGTAYLNYTDRLPRMIIPATITVFVFILAVTISISSFKGISSALGGESEISGLSKLV